MSRFFTLNVHESVRSSPAELLSLVVYVVLKQNILSVEDNKNNPNNSSLPSCNWRMMNQRRGASFVGRKNAGLGSLTTSIKTKSNELDSPEQCFRVTRSLLTCVKINTFVHLLQYFRATTSILSRSKLTYFIQQIKLIYSVN